ncbi:hypothetical protein BKA65DRAFT_575049 [Rhexocercosporidium sp. MPI-PUGE-AT-0058]|nr:hypothetical protein BKA65DRAFT_575049 [Rhexocercosporidium sp. MPI-PUGE-AT-0058]
MVSSENTKSYLKSPQEDIRNGREAEKWRLAHLPPAQILSPSSSKLATLTTKLKSFFISKDKQTSTQDTDPTFHQFSLLPNELQLQIWTYAVQAPLRSKPLYIIITSHLITPTPTPHLSPLTKCPLQKPTTFSSKTLSPFFSLSDPIPSPNPSNKIFFPIAPLLHACSLSRHVFRKEWEPILPVHLRGVIERTGRWVVLMTRVLERQGQGILVLEEEVGWEGVGSSRCGGRLDRREGRVVTYYLFNYL